MAGDRFMQGLRKKDGEKGIAMMDTIESVNKRTDLAVRAPKPFYSVLPRTDFAIPVTYRCWGCGSSIVKQEATAIPIPAKTIWNVCQDCLKGLKPGSIQFSGERKLKDKGFIKVF